mgnify:CR=1 FL=1
MTAVYLGLGANLGDRFGYIQEALRRLDRADGFRITQLSSLYETEPVGHVQQGPFLNLVVEGVTDLTPRALLAECLAIEKQLGRRRGRRWGPRTIDIDLLLYGRRRLQAPDLVIPHPRMKERAFVLVPLDEIAPRLVLPGGETVRGLLRNLKNKDGIKVVEGRVALADRVFGSRYF